ncbi:diaminopimelate decarboxylase [Ruminococcus flavefaciens]|uniref:diaminopimelate decarboxylase n=1 Tax=Ruminococcus flavefaciens TaxID=1265 RepID=UPI0026EC1DE5|nr:diaminopimelate decarboxylase [Ruminococcus flavefaciens]MDD7515659.1 diaminopimelate decarboxylase [Ruminococcus flavefaciens]MDY5690354.1 diaminopimelate decarboxylase [Ruminococcus flavefaciens]
MFVSENLGVNDAGHLTIGGIDTVALAKEYGTPLYVMDEQLIRKNLRRFHDSMNKYYNGKGEVHYASKAFSCMEMCRVVASEGDGLDAVSIGELYTALKAGFPMEKVGFHGNNKTDEELIFALKAGVGHIIVDNISELHRLEAIAAEMKVQPHIMFRIKPGIDAHTHDFVKTGQIDSKFGFALETGEAFEAVKEAINCKNVKLSGLHCHIGSQIFDIAPFEEAAKVMLGFIAKIKNELGYEIEGLNLGGGFGIKYLDEHDPAPFEVYLERVSDVVRTECERLGIKLPFMYIEPGRSIAAPAGITLYTVGARKEIPNIRTYVSVDGGMADSPRYILYGSEYEAVVANKANEERSEKVTIAGKCCESGDLIGENMPLQHAESGDIIAVCATGAYNYSMSSNYNRLQKPAVVFVNEGKSRIAVKRESLDDIIKNDI